MYRKHRANFTPAPFSRLISLVLRITITFSYLDRVNYCVGLGRILRNCAAALMRVYTFEILLFLSFFFFAHLDTLLVILPLKCYLLPFEARKRREKRRYFLVRSFLITECAGEDIFNDDVVGTLN